MIRRLLLLLALAGGLLLAGCSSDDGADELANDVEIDEFATAEDVGEGGARVEDMEEPKMAPDIELATMDGGTINPAEREGELILVNFWATWCPPCRVEIPDLIELQDELGPEGLTVIGISVDREDADTVLSFAEEHEINYPLVHDPDNELDEHFGQVFGLPTTFVIGPDGTIDQRVVGIFPADMKDDLAATLDEA